MHDAGPICWSILYADRVIECTPQGLYVFTSSTHSLHSCKTALHRGGKFLLPKHAGSQNCTDFWQLASQVYGSACQRSLKFSCGRSVQIALEPNSQRSSLLTLSYKTPAKNSPGLSGWRLRDFCEYIDEARPDDKDMYHLGICNNFLPDKHEACLLHLESCTQLHDSPLIFSGGFSVV